MKIIEKPMSTAPKDSTVIAVWDQENEPLLVFWDRMCSFWACTDPDDLCPEVEFEPTGWITKEEHDMYWDPNTVHDIEFL